MLKKRGQFTIFVILGIVILVAFGIAFCVRNFLQAGNIELQAEQIVKQALSTSPIDYYVTTCVEQVTDEALFYVGMQGGNIYDYQGGNITFTSSHFGTDYLQTEYNGTDQNVSYGLRLNQDTECFDTQIPEYPFDKVYMSDVLWKYYYKVLFGDCEDPKLINGPFGKNTMQSLCNSEGFNAYNISNMSFFSCMRGTYDVEGYNLSVQEQIEDYVGEKIQDCVNFTVFEEVSNKNITVLNEPRATLIFGKEGFNINVSYPFKVSVNGGEPVTILQSFQTHSDVRLKEIYTIAHKIITSDAQNIFYNKSKDLYNTRIEVLPGNQNITLEIIKHPCNTNSISCKYDEILRITDNASLVKNKPFVFQVALQNRVPALDYIHTRQSDFFDIVTSENRTIFLNPKGYDPDETDINYTYIGWREDYWQKFNETCCEDVNCTDIDELLLNMAECFPIIQVPVYNWTLSRSYLTTQRQANYTPNFNDTGIHFMTIMIEDESGKIDYQNISILVFDLPQANATGYNDYINIPNNRTSIEDPYYLDASQSAVYLTNLLVFEWNDTTEPFYNVTKEEVLLLPFDLYPNTNMLNINESIFTVDTLHEIILRASSDLNVFTWGEADILEVNVTECLPHENTGKDPYPFNTTYGFLANHSCCDDNYNYSPSSKACYSETRFGADSVLDMTTFWDMSLNLQAGPTYFVGENPTTNNNRTNDVFNSTFLNYCSGNRGNICSGDAEEVRTVYADCNDWEGTETERCQGPEYDDSRTYAFGCTNYSNGTSFEKARDLPGLTAIEKNGICNEETQCSDKSSFTDPTVNVKFSCLAQCNDGTCSWPAIDSCLCNSSCGAGDDNCTGLYNACYNDEGYCSDECDYQGPDASIDGCDCYEGSNNGECEVNKQNCWVDNNSNSFCCQDGDYACDGVFESAIGACNNGAYFTDPDQNEITCNCTQGLNAWFGYTKKCCDKTTDIIEKGPEDNCCYNGEAYADDTYTGPLLCHEGELYGCLTHYSSEVQYVLQNQIIGTFTCTSGVWHI